MQSTIRKNALYEHTLNNTVTTCTANSSNIITLNNYSNYYTYIIIYAALNDSIFNQIIIPNDVNTDAYYPIVDSNNSVAILRITFSRSNSITINPSVSGVKIQLITAR